MIDGIRQAGKTYRGEYAVQQKLGVRDQQDNKRPEDNEMINAKGFGQHPFLTEGILQHLSEANADPVKTIFCCAKGHQTEPAPAAPGKNTEGYDKKRSEYGRIGCHVKTSHRKLLF